MPKVTIEDISRHTGLSRGTVSRALNDRPDISDLTKQRVLDACRELNYVPSQAARSLATGRTYVVAILVDDLASVEAAEFVRGAGARADAANYALRVVELGDGATRQTRLDRVARERIDSMLIAAPLDGAAVALIREALGPRPSAARQPLEGLACDVFTTDQRESGRLVARHLLQVAGDALLYLHAPGRPSAEARLSGFREVLEGRGLDAGRMVIDVPPGDGPDTFTNILQGRLEAVRGIGAADDYLAIGAMIAAARLGRVPGRDLAVMGQGNEPASARIRPGLSTTDLTAEEAGQRAMEIVLQRLEHARLDAPERALLAPTIVARASTRLG